MTNRHAEDDEQTAYFYWVGVMARQDNRFLLIYANPNGGKRNVREATRMKRQGVRAGVPDINIDSPSPFYAGLRIELKRPMFKGQPKPVVSAVQKEWLTRLQAAGYVCCVCYGATEAMAATTAYLAGKPVPCQWIAGHNARIERLDGREETQ